MPCINTFNVDPNIINKMFPISFNIPKYDQSKTCYSKFNSGYCNLKYFGFDRKLVYTLDRWLFELTDTVVMNRLNKKFPTSYFENQNLTDVVCILLFIIACYLDKKNLNILSFNRL